MLGCNESNIMPHFRTFCELVEGEENKLTNFHMDYNVRV